MIESLNEMNPVEKKEFLATHAAFIEEGRYFQRFNGEDMVIAQSEFSDVCIKLDQEKEKFEQIRAEAKVKLKELDELRKEALTKLKAQGEFLDGKLFAFDDQEKGMMHYYNAAGDLISSRRLKPEERQMNI